MSIDYSQLKLTASEKALVRRERLDGMDSDDLLDVQTRAQDAGAGALADRIGDLRVKVERHQAALENGDAGDQGDELETRKTGGAGGARKTARRRRRKTASSRIGGAARRGFLDTPVNATAGAVETAGGMFWRIVGMTIALSFLYMVLTKPAPASGALHQLQLLVTRSIYPRGAFPEKYTGARSQTTPTRKAA